MMFHQSDFRNDSEHSSQNDNNDFQYKVNILVKKQIQEISSKTSNPARVSEAMERLIGIQTYQQGCIGRMWFMEELLRQNIFPHEVHVLA